MLPSPFLSSPLLPLFPLTGLKEDRLAFKVTFVSHEPLFFRAAKPNERRQWVEALEKVMNCLGAK